MEKEFKPPSKCRNAPAKVLAEKAGGISTGKYPFSITSTWNDIALSIRYLHDSLASRVPQDFHLVARTMSAKRTKKRKEATEQQLFLPFEITAPARSRRMSLKLVSTSVRRYQLQLTVGLSR